ncbi:MAG: NFACT RNA binding domain-containing protein [Treponema sp.]|jgi:predicted ribosome quality control (RQC) complex YloA/Tae2 family protein|nr:NFACT RNA binding domain-containing protein [Treponema sp.]
MSLNWKEINLLLSELDLPGSRIQKVLQSAYDVAGLEVYGRGKTRMILIALTPGACRIHETFRAMPRSERPLRFAEFCKSRIVNGWIESAEQLGDNRIVRLIIRQGKNRCHFYIRLWSNAANVVVTGEDGTILDAMRRSPRRGEITGGRFVPEEAAAQAGASGFRGDVPRPRQEYRIRELPGGGSFNERIDAWYAEHGGALSLEALKEQVRRNFEGRMGRLKASLERLRAKEADYESADRFKEYGDIIMANMGSIEAGAGWLDALNFYTREPVRIKLDPRKRPPAMAEYYYGQYRKAKTGLAEVRAEIGAGEAELVRLEKAMEELLAQTNPLALHRLIKSGGVKAASRDDRTRPGLSFRRGDWLIIVGRDAAENDALLRRHVKGNDLWLHARDFSGSYVFVKQRAGKTIPLDILLDAGNLALFYSKGRNNGAGDLFYTPVKFLRRAKNGPRGLVIPTQEKNLHIKLDEKRLKELERCRIEK